MADLKWVKDEAMFTDWEGSTDTDDGVVSHQSLGPMGVGDENFCGLPWLIPDRLSFRAAISALGSVSAGPGMRPTAQPLSRSTGSEKVKIAGSEASLEGLWLPAGSSVSDRAVLLCHPHPLHGGTMETKLVARVARRLSESGYQTLRFNFRGVGQSEGAWSGGLGERADAVAALDYAAKRLPGARFAMFGFSFGAVVALEVGGRDPRVSAIVGVAPPIRLFLSGCPQDLAKPRLIIAAEADEVVDTGELVAWVKGLSEPSEFLLIKDADHLFSAQTVTVAAAVVDFLDRALG